jgi:hypothetical protein
VGFDIFPGYRSNIVAYLFSYLSHFSNGQLNFQKVWDDQSISPELTSVLKNWAGQIDTAIRESAKGRNVTEWCKKVECWNSVSALKLHVGHTVPPEMMMSDLSEEENVEGAASVGGLDLRSHDGQRGDDQEMIDVCTTLDAATWSKISYWGTATQRLNQIERGVAHTLSEYASGNWIKRPSVKQARRGMRAIELAREAGIIGRE